MRKKSEWINENGVWKAHKSPKRQKGRTLCERTYWSLIISTCVHQQMQIRFFSCIFLWFFFPFSPKKKKKKKKKRQKHQSVSSISSCDTLLLLAPFLTLPMFDQVPTTSYSRKFGWKIILKITLSCPVNCYHQFASESCPNRVRIVSETCQKEKFQLNRPRFIKKSFPESCQNRVIFMTCQNRVRNMSEWEIPILSSKNYIPIVFRIRSESCHNHVMFMTCQNRVRNMSETCQNEKFQFNRRRIIKQSF